MSLLARLFRRMASRPAPDPAPVQKRLAEIAHLSPGWLDGQGPGFDPIALQALSGFLTRSICDGMPAPDLNPTINGEVQADWGVGPFQITARFTITKVGT